MVVIATAWKKKINGALTCHRMYLTPYFSNDDDVRPVLDHLMLYQRDALHLESSGRSHAQTNPSSERVPPRGENWSESALYATTNENVITSCKHNGGGEVSSSVSKIKKVNSRHEKIIKCRRTRGFGCRTPPSFLFFFSGSVGARFRWVTGRELYSTSFLPTCIQTLVLVVVF